MKSWLMAGLIALIPTAQAADDKTADKKAAAEIARTFVAEASGNTIAIYSKSKKARRCDVSVLFSIMIDGQRVTGLSRCFEADIVAGDHVKMCEFSRPSNIEPKIEGPVTGYCK